MEKKITHLPPIGLRIIKSSIGVLLCYVVYLLRGREGIVFYSQLAILWCMQPYIQNSITMAIQRTTGTLIGALFGLITVLCRIYILNSLPNGDILYYILVSFMIIPILYTTVLMKKKNASYFSTVVYLSIVVAHIGDAHPFIFILNRIIDTMIGIILGVIVNMFRIPRKKRSDILFISGVDDTLINDKEVLSPFSKIELNRMLQEGANFTLSTMRTPGSIADALGDIQWKLPMIVMDGAALYDMKEERYLSVVELNKSHVETLKEFLHIHEIDVFTNIIIDDLLVISYETLHNKAEHQIYEKLHRSPYRHYVRVPLENKGQVLYLMAIDETTKMERLFEEIKQLPIYSDLKVNLYPSKDYPGYSYIKIYDRQATRENMIRILKEYTGLKKTMTFGSIEGQYDMVIHKNDSNRVVKTLSKMYEPYFWCK